MKYVIGTQGFVIFPDQFVHKDMASACEMEIGSPVSAGFVRIQSGKFYTYGRSNSLRLNSSPTDSDTLNEKNNMQKL